MRKSQLFLFFTFFLLLLLIVGCGNSNNEKTDENQKESSSDDVTQENVSLPEQMVWSVYDVGASGYSEMSAIADVLSKNYETKIRLLPSGSGIGRMTPLSNDKASIGKVGDEIQFAFEGINAFAERSWGPQNVRAYWAPISQYGLLASKDSDIKSIADIKGKKFPHIVGNDSLNIKNEAMLAFAGLTLDDVELVDITSYGASVDAFVTGQIDVLGAVPSSSALAEVESRTKIHWLEMDPNDVDGWERVEEVAPWLFSETRDDGIGMEGDTSLLGHGYLIAGYADQDPDFIYEFLKAMDENFDQYKDTITNLKRYSKDVILTEPRGIPFHEGTIKFLEENGLWDEEKQEKNDQLVERYNKLRDAWDQVVDESVEQGIVESEFPDFWLERKAELVQ